MYIITRTEPHGSAVFLFVLHPHLQYRLNCMNLTSLVNLFLLQHLGELRKVLFVTFLPFAHCSTKLVIFYLSKKCGLVVFGDLWNLGTSFGIIGVVSLWSSVML